MYNTVFLNYILDTLLIRIPLEKHASVHLRLFACQYAAHHWLVCARKVFLWPTIDACAKAMHEIHCDSGLLFVQPQLAISSVNQAFVLQLSQILGVALPSTTDSAISSRQPFASHRLLSRGDEVSTSLWQMRLRCRRLTPWLFRGGSWLWQ